MTTRARRRQTTARPDSRRQQPGKPGEREIRAPAAPAGETSRTVRFDLSDEEFAEIGTAAQRAGLAKGAYAAQVVSVHSAGTCDLVLGEVGDFGHADAVANPKALRFDVWKVVGAVE